MVKVRGRLRSTCHALLLALLPLVGGCSGQWVDYFFTSDQQGRYAMEQNQFSSAADLFHDPMWKGVAAYRAGRYLEAADTFARVTGADGLFNMGNALVKGREYSRAVTAYEQALVIDPQHIGAKQNLEITRAIMAYLNEARSAGGTEVGADDVRYDNTAEKGQETVIAGQTRMKIESTEQWMRAVETQPRDFLRTKFAIEASK